VLLSSALALQLTALPPLATQATNPLLFSLASATHWLALLPAATHLTTATDPSCPIARQSEIEPPTATQSTTATLPLDADALQFTELPPLAVPVHEAELPPVALLVEVTVPVEREIMPPLLLVVTISSSDSELPSSSEPGPAASAMQPTTPVATSNDETANKKTVDFLMVLLLLGSLVYNLNTGSRIASRSSGTYGLPRRCTDNIASALLTDATCIGNGATSL
jgi:hypothetical protein